MFKLIHLQLTNLKTTTMTKLKFLLCAALALLFSITQKAKAQLPIADPYIFVEGDTYYAYGTGSDYGIPVYTSKDLKTWKAAGLALHKKDTNIPKWFWAPEVYKIEGKYYMHFSGNEHLYAAVADSPLGPFKQCGNGKPMIEERAIDSSLFFDKDGKKWIYFVRMNDGNNVWVAPLNDDYISFDLAKAKHVFSVSQEWERAQARVNEGPCVFRKGKKYYMIYSANDYQSPKYGLGLAIAKDPEGPWVKRDDNPFMQCVDTLVGVGHNSFFTDMDGKFRIVFHAHKDKKHVHPRMSYIGTLEFADPKDKDHLTLGRDIIVPKVTE